MWTDASSAKKKNPPTRSVKRAAKVAQDDVAKRKETACFLATISATPPQNVEHAARQAAARAVRPVSVPVLAAGALAVRVRVLAKLRAPMGADARRAKASKCPAVFKVGDRLPRECRGRKNQSGDQDVMATAVRLELKAKARAKGSVAQALLVSARPRLAPAHLFLIKMWHRAVRAAPSNVAAARVKNHRSVLAPQLLRPTLTRKSFHRRKALIYVAWAMKPNQANLQKPWPQVPTSNVSVCTRYWRNRATVRVVTWKS